MKEDNNISNISEQNGATSAIIIDKIDVLARKHILTGKNIGVSVSESESLNELGYGVSHLKDAIVEIARYILALGGRLTYGGDMRNGGFTELFFDLLAYYKADKLLPPYKRFNSYLSWPLSLQLSTEKEAELKQNVTFKKVAPPTDLKLPNLQKFLQPNTSENLYIWARCLTKMREEMESSCDARIFIGGKQKGFKGKCPGILEEVSIAIKHEHPLYLIGAFGGITQSIIEALDNRRTEAFSKEYYFDSSEYRGFFDLYNTKHAEDAIDYDQYFATLKNLGFQGVSKSNGLSVEDNKRLAVTPHLNEIVYLIIKGLTNNSNNSKLRET